MKELIGKKFKRNVYGLSDWASTIKEVNITKSTTFNLELQTAFWTPKIWIKSENGVPYDLDEIVIIMEDVNWDMVDKFKDVLKNKISI